MGQKHRDENEDRRKVWIDIDREQTTPFLRRADEKLTCPATDALHPNRISLHDPQKGTADQSLDRAALDAGLNDPPGHDSRAVIHQIVRALAAKLGMTIEELTEHIEDEGRRLRPISRESIAEIDKLLEDLRVGEVPGDRFCIAWKEASGVAQPDSRLRGIVGRVLRSGVVEKRPAKADEPFPAANHWFIKDRIRLFPVPASGARVLAEASLLVEQHIDSVRAALAFRRICRPAKVKRLLERARTDGHIALWAGCLRGATGHALSNEAVARTIVRLLSAVLGQRRDRSTILRKIASKRASSA